MPIDDELLRLLRETQGHLDANARRMEDLQTAQEARLTLQEARLAELETAAGEQLRGLRAQVSEQAATLRLAGETMEAVMDVCRRHGFDPAAGLSALEWLEYVLDNAAAGWPSVN